MRTGVGGCAARRACGSRRTSPRQVLQDATPPALMGGPQAWRPVSATDASPRCAPSRAASPPSPCTRPHDPVTSPSSGPSWGSPGPRGVRAAAGSSLSGRLSRALRWGPPTGRDSRGRSHVRRGPAGRCTRPAGGAAGARRGCSLRPRFLRGGGRRRLRGTAVAPSRSRPRPPPARPRSSLRTSPAGPPPVPECLPREGSHHGH